MVVHPAPGHPRGTLVNAMLHHLNGAPLPAATACLTRAPSDDAADEDDAGADADGRAPPAIDDDDADDAAAATTVASEAALAAAALRPGIVHRLDKGTSGVILVAKTPQVIPRRRVMPGTSPSTTREQSIPNLGEGGRSHQRMWRRPGRHAGGTVNRQIWRGITRAAPHDT